jgi:hypothetical protein
MPSEILEFLIQSITQKTPEWISALAADVKVRTEDHAAEFFSELRKLGASGYCSDPKNATSSIL